MKGETLVKNYVGEAAIAAYRIVKFGASDGSVLQANAATDLLIGATGRTYPEVANERVDIVREGFAEVEYGATVLRGQKLTADAQGRAIPAAPGGGNNVQVIGVAEVSGLVGDIGSMLIASSVMQG